MRDDARALERGRDQLLLVRPDSKYHHVDLLEFADGGARTLASAVLEPGSWIDGWLGPNDLQLVGNLSGHGSSQLLLLHRGQRRPGEQAVLLSLQNGLEAPRKLYADNWGERQWLDGWLDPNDVHMVGDFMGLGYDQWMMMNRNPRGGRVRIVDIKGGTPRRCYTEMWGQSPLLDGWMDEGRIMLAGDFLKRGHMQVLFINRNIAINTGKILIADFCRAAPPAEVCYRELWGQSDLVNDFIADSDVQVAGDFMGRGYAQVLFVSRKGEGEKFLVADFHRGAPPAEACVREQWGQRARHESLVHPGSVVRAGRFRRSGNIDTPRRNDVDMHTPAQQRQERPAEFGIFDRKPRPLPVGEFHALDLQIRREEAAQSPKADFAVGCRRQAGHDRRQGALRRPGLQHCKQDHQNGDEAAHCPGKEPYDPHQKACPRLT